MLPESYGRSCAVSHRREDARDRAARAAGGRGPHWGGGFDASQ